MSEIEVEMVPVETVQEEIATAKKTGGGKWSSLVGKVFATGNAAVVTGLTKGQVAAASKACKAVDTVSCRTFYAKGKVILYPTPE
ncbi:unnamed protein product [marine sediment metagenome]|uniref:Uncharacterized protein n=1 Tax=marine sediment metagenome TaxID=412755 RepID=X1STN1_9ZZZZ